MCRLVRHSMRHLSAQALRASMKLLPHQQGCKCTTCCCLQVMLRLVWQLGVSLKPFNSLQQYPQAAHPTSLLVSGWCKHRQAFGSLILLLIAPVWAARVQSFLSCYALSPRVNARHTTFRPPHSLSRLFLLLLPFGPSAACPALVVVIHFMAISGQL